MQKYINMLIHNIINGEKMATGQNENEPATQGYIAEAKTSEIEVYRYTEPSGIAMYCIPKQLTELHAFKDLTGGNALEITEFEKGLKRLPHEPYFTPVAKMTYNFAYLMDALRTAKKLKATYITIEIDKEGILRLSIKHVKGDELKKDSEVPERSFKFYLAPYKEEDY